MNPALAAVLAGVAGWAGENTLETVRAPKSAPPETRYSAHLPGVPFLPVYAAGGALLSLLTPTIQSAPWPLRGLAYAGALTALEAGSGYAERAQGRQSWDYNGKPADLSHAALWGALGLLAEPLFKR